jgi:protein involved in polysaccharide export with SLBB domain
MKLFLSLLVALLVLCAPAAAQDSTGGTLLRAGDVLRVGVWPDVTLSGEFPIESSGEIYLPLVGGVQAAGRPLEEVRAELRDRFRGFIENAIVTATPLFRVSVIGAVQRPNLYQVDPTHTVFDLISLAGGFTSTAQLSAVRLIRGNTVLELDAAGALATGDGALLLGLLSGDRLVVPERADRGRTLQPIWAAIQALAILTTLALQIF